jgi:hypothetical protein
MRPAKLVTASEVLLPKAFDSLPVWKGDLSKPSDALEYLEARSRKSHRGLNEDRDREALMVLIQTAVDRLNQAAPHQPPVCRVEVSWGPVDPLSGLRYLELTFWDTQDRRHDQTWAAQEWQTPSGVPDRALGQWPLDNRSRRLGGGWEHWFRILAEGLSFEEPLVIPVALPANFVPDPSSHQEEEKRPTSQRKRTGPR